MSIAASRMFERGPQVLVVVHLVDEVVAAGPT
jgi:hypothetical protein